MGFLFDIKDAKNMNSCASGRKYYLSCNLKFDDGHKVLCENEEHINNALIILNTEDFSYQIIRGIDVNNMLLLKTETVEKLLITFNSGNKNKIAEIVEDSSYFEQGLPKFWSSFAIFKDFDTKLFTKLVIDSDAGINVKLVYDSGSQTFTTYKKGINEFSFKIISKQLRFEISSEQKNAEVNHLYLDYYDYK